ncbi:3-hydroxy-3-methylglutaryl CoA synthase [Kibdelosporangium banguiense]|uniref:3-hydroxy-3-methylglutaryl CoA synthase n=1 Tax=Kibdelosporangium banguiense TaxID=1365924 RepID=A0ABS4TUJ8_9PSEU|nr:OB-fold domain-containing protein [Kibdelosporangium banguiense]MBP2328048.1 3-hydroxy-3-methylglutaryl CoA synthase [Kibdelosporangium banguiense]
MRGILSMAAYIPPYRVATASGGIRTLAAHDQDTTTLGVEAGWLALHGRDTDEIERLLFATTTPAYLDKNNASAVHAALGLPSAVAAVDTGGALRSGIGSLLTALQGGPPTLVVAADMRTGRPGSDEERLGGDAAAAVVVGEGTGVIAEFLGCASSTLELMDRWRLAGETTARIWEDRFGESAYLGEVSEVVDTALARAGVARHEVRLLVSGAHARAVTAVRRALGVKTADELTATTGHCGAAHSQLLLVAALEEAEPGDVFALVSLADGVDVLVFRATSVGARPVLSLRDQLASPGHTVTYEKFLTWRGFLTREPPRRPNPARPTAPSAFRHRDWKFALAEAGGRRLSTVHGTVTTYTTDHLAHSPSPPTIVAVVDLDGGGRRVTELTDVAPDAVSVGDRVEMTFRRFRTADGVHNYFWKARPERLGTGA